MTRDEQNVFYRVPFRYQDISIYSFGLGTQTSNCNLSTRWGTPDLTALDFNALGMMKNKKRNLR